MKYDSDAYELCQFALNISMSCQPEGTPVDKMLRDAAHILAFLRRETALTPAAPTQDSEEH
jgi:hypothetical protein